MTEHPLTDEICEGLVTFPLESEHDYIEMRAAADWQLEQVIEWLRNNLRSSAYLSTAFCGSADVDTATVLAAFYEIDVLEVVDDLKEAMRPQKDN